MAYNDIQCYFVCLLFCSRMPICFLEIGGIDPNVVHAGSFFFCRCIETCLWDNKKFSSEKILFCYKEKLSIYRNRADLSGHFIINIGIFKGLLIQHFNFFEFFFFLDLDLFVDELIFETSLFIFVDTWKSYWDDISLQANFSFQTFIPINLSISDPTLTVSGNATHYLVHFLFHLSIVLLFYC